MLKHAVPVHSSSNGPTHSNNVSMQRQQQQRSLNSTMRSMQQPLNVSTLTANGLGPPNTPKMMNGHGPPRGQPFYATPLPPSLSSHNSVNYNKEQAGAKEALTSLGLLCLVSLLLALLSLIFLLKISPNGREPPPPPFPTVPEDYAIVYDVTLALCALSLSLNLCCLLVCAIQFLFAVKLVRTPPVVTSRGNKYLQKSSVSRVCAVGGFFMSIPIFLTGIILYTFTQFHSTTAIATSILIGIGILFCGGAMVHNVFVWQKEKTISVRQQMTMPLNLSAISPPTPFMNTLNSTNLMNHSVNTLNHSMNNHSMGHLPMNHSNHHLSFNHSQMSQPNHLNHTHLSTFSRQTPITHLAQIPGGQVPSHSAMHHHHHQSNNSSQYVPTHTTHYSHALGGGGGGGSQLTPMSGSQLTPMSANHSHLSFSYPPHMHPYTIRTMTGTPPTPRIGHPVMPPVIPTRDTTGSVTPMGQMPTIDVNSGGGNNGGGPNSPQSELSTLV